MKIEVKIKGTDIDGMATSMATAVMDAGGGHVTGMHEGVDGDGYQWTMVMGIDKGVEERRSATGPWNSDMVHYHRHSSGLYPFVSLHMRILLGQCMLPCTPKRAPHLPNATMPTQSCTHLQLGRNIIT